MGVITLTSDMGLRDHYVASVKGAIISQNAEAIIVDVSHQVEPFNILQAAFILKNCYKNFPPGTVHVLCVDDEPKSHQRYLSVEKDGHFFIASDSGVIPIVLDNEYNRAVEISLSSESEDGIFVAKDILAKAAGYLSRGGTMEFLGKETQDVNKRSILTPTTSSNEITGYVVHIDVYGNGITNIDKHLFNLIGKKRPFDIIFGAEDYNINRISNHYGAVPQGEKCALFNGNGLLEIALNRGTPQTGGGADQLLGLQVGNTVRIEFTDVTNR
ncbi:MAG: SAM hydrolase/SAM-dependent halogenase family protein [Luteibaculum sp.]